MREKTMSARGGLMIIRGRLRTEELRRAASDDSSSEKRLQ
jgi:hypothetical protein